MTKTFGNLIAAEMAALKADLARVTAERDALNIEIEQAHCFLDECFVNDPDACDAGTKPLAERIMDLDDARGLEIVRLQEQVAAHGKERAFIIAEAARLQGEVKKLQADYVEWAKAIRAWKVLYDLRGERVEALREQVAAQDKRIRELRTYAAYMEWLADRRGDKVQELYAEAERYAKEHSDGN